MLLEKIKNGEILLFDGAMGTQLQEHGMSSGELPERYNIEHQDILKSIHQSYLKSGAMVLTTNTFGANKFKMDDENISVEETITCAINNCREAIESLGIEAYIALDIGPVGQLMEPMGTLTFDQVYELVKEQVLIGEKLGVDLVLFETISDVYELKAGILSVKENTSLPIFATLTFESNMRTLSGTDPLSACNILEGLGVDVLGMNCSLGPLESKDILQEILKYSNIPVMIQPNAGLPKIVGDETIYDISKELFTQSMEEFLDMGVQVIGGCCGTTPEYTWELSKLIQRRNMKVVKRDGFQESVVSSPVKSHIFTDNFTIVGERINPTGKKKLKEALRNNDYSYIINEGITQEKMGAEILDVNVGLPEYDEGKKMVEVVKVLQEITTLPLQIDSSDVNAIEQGCRYYNGKPLVNSVNGKESNMQKIFPIIKKYGGIVIGLTLDESGIPDTAEKRFAIAKKIVDTAKTYGIDKKDIIIDTLVLTASAQQKEVLETLKTIRLVKDNLGVRTSLGVSNVSFGLPQRFLINRTFLTMALSYGLDVAILNPNNEDMLDAIRSFRVLNYLDVDSQAYIEYYSNKDSEKGNTRATENNNNISNYSLVEIIKAGLKDLSAPKTIEMLKDLEPLEIINKHIIVALDDVGSKFETGEYFLPQLIQSAETVKNSFSVLKEAILNSGKTEEPKGKVLLATVEGDIHDIGKNIVKVLLENYGYEIIDMGRDVAIDDLVNCALEEKVQIVGLSALMTTTVRNMEKTIKALRERNYEGPIMVGGAVLSPEYCEMIQGDFYGRDARDAVRICEEIFKK